ncbi:protein kinase domain-containing protein [Actinoplanes sp. NPDC049118]|uniref:serine/threonine-protein kinase n=1 Tax=Actinoplanes sp. NPDC049118 TaxID=3155769 RepID=UPI0033E8A687
MDQDPTGSGTRPDSLGASTLDLSGRCVGSSYLLVRPIGQGATGTVWRGVDRSSGEPVAVKLLHESLLRQPKLVTRFVQERTILMMLRHRNVVRVRDLFSVGESLGLVMDLVPGGSLREYLREHHTLRPGEAARLAAQVAAALAEAHELGIVHRDLKPDNILLHREDGQLDIRLTDFGIARVLNTPSLTTPNAVVGTPHYMSPEAFHGTPTSPAADVYALGVLIYETVCGRPPYDSDNVHELMQLHLQGDPERPPGVPDEIWDVIVGCLDQKPRLRPTAAELIADLSDVARRAADAPALPRPAGTPSRPPAPSCTPDAPPPAPVHPSLAGRPKLPAPRGRNQPASWRWGRPWAMIGLVAAAILASGVTTTAWHLGRGNDPGADAVAQAPAPQAPRARPAGSAAASAASTPPAPAKTAAPAQGAAGRRQSPIAAQALTPARPRKSQETRRPAGRQGAGTRAPVREAKEYGPESCRRQFTVVNFSNPMLLNACHAIGAKVQIRAVMTAPSRGEGRISVALRDLGTGRLAGAPKVCAGLGFSRERAMHDCGPVTLNPPRGHRYEVVLAWSFTAAGRPAATGEVTGDDFGW